MGTKSIAVTISSWRNQDVTLIVRDGIEQIVAPKGVLTTKPQTDATTCVLHLPENVPVTLHLRTGSHKPSEWVLHVPPLNQTIRSNSGLDT